jgi:hypothetical protein
MVSVGLVAAKSDFSIPVILQAASVLVHSLTRITYWRKLIGIPSLAALMQLELFRVQVRIIATKVGVAARFMV